MTADGFDHHLFAIYGRHLAATGHPGIGYANRHITAAGIIPICMAANTRFVNRFPHSADGILNPEIEIRMISGTQIPDIGSKVAMAVCDHNPHFIAIVKKRPQPIPHTYPRPNKLDMLN